MRSTNLRLTLLALLVAVAAITGLDGPLVQGPAPAHAAFAGDYNCDGRNDAEDAVAVLEVAADLQPLADCADPLSADCDGLTDVMDALLILRDDAGLTVTLPEGCRPIGSLTADTPPGEAAVLLADLITGEDDLARVVTAVNDTLSYAGVSVGVEGDILLAARPPATDQIVIPMESLNLALEARDRSSVTRTTADDLAGMLADFGWPFADGSTPGEQFSALIHAWVTEAGMDKTDPRNFVPLFLVESEKHASPPVDLTTHTVPPDLLTFDTLEVELILASFDRETDPPAAPAAVLAAAPTPCSDAKKYITDTLGPFAGQLSGVAVSEGVSNGMEKALTNAGISSSTAGDFSKAMSALAIAARLWKLVAFYENAQVSVTVVDANPQHKNSESDPDLLKLFTASAGVSEEDWKAYVDKYGETGAEVNTSVRDCLQQLGLPTLADLGEIANDAAGWAVDWNLYANPKHAQFSRAAQPPGGMVLPGKWRTGLTRNSDYQAQATYVVNILGRDKAADHPGQMKSTPVTVCAKVDASQLPTLGTFVNAAKGVLGLADAVSELVGAGLLQVVQPTSCLVLTVTWHEANKCPFNPAPAAGSASGTVFALSADDDVPPCAYEGTASATYHAVGDDQDGYIVMKANDLRLEFLRIAYDGSFVYNIVGGSVTTELSGTLLDCVVSGGSTVTFGEISEDQNLTATIQVFPGEGYVLDGYAADYDDPAKRTCVNPFGGGTVDLEMIYHNFYMHRPDYGPVPATDFQSLSGSRDDADSTGTVHWEWDFHAAECAPSTQPVCIAALP